MQKEIIIASKQKGNQNWKASGASTINKDCECWNKFKSNSNYSACTNSACTIVYYNVLALIMCKKNPKVKGNNNINEEFINSNI